MFYFILEFFYNHFFNRVDVDNNIDIDDAVLGGTDSCKLFFIKFY